MNSSTQGLTSCAACGIAFPLGARFCPSCGAALGGSGARAATPRVVASPNGDPLLGRIIADRYRILSLLGRGGMGVVYRVEHVHIGKLMAMKLLSGELASDPLTLKRFQREAQAVSRLSHPNTVQIFDSGESESLVYLVMEYLPGRDLATLIAERGALPFARVARLCVQIAGSVDEAHQHGIIHRDIKPENVMVLDTSEQRDLVKVLDFGIAKLRDLEEGAPATQKGHLIGTPYYMAPEQIRGDPIDGRVDVYALGALMYKALTGEPPFTADMPMEVLTKHLNEPLVPMRRRAPERDIPVEAERIVGKALAKDRADRYASMAELRDELERVLSEQGAAVASVPPPRLPPQTLATRGDVDRYERRLRRASRAGKVLGVLVLCFAAAAYIAWRGRRATEPARGEEREPNDGPAEANELVPGAPLKAKLGKRISPSEGDADIYRIELASVPQVADIAVSSLPNIDLAIDLVERGSAQPLLTVDTGGVGEPERIPNYTLLAHAYYVRVREPLAAGRYPTENVSDSYTIALSLSAARSDSEHEPNDGVELAEPLAEGAKRSGLIGWAGDRDVYCLAKGSSVRVLEVSGVPNLDLTVAALDRHTDVSHRIDRKGVGEGERVELSASQSQHETCITVSARERDGAAKAAPETPYELVVR